MFALPVVIKL